MRIRALSIIGEGELRGKLEGLLLKADVKVVTSDLSSDYAKQSIDADLVLEDVVEDIAVKKKVLKRCDAGCHKGTILATTTANPWITQIAAVTKRPDSVVGLNFTKNPFDGNYLVQIVKGLQTSEHTVRACEEFLGQADIAFVELQENPGFILDRVIASVINEAAVMYMTKLATVEDIDKMMKMCVNWPMGPFELADTVGLDKVLEILDSMSQQLGPRYQPCFLLRKMVDAGCLGKKTDKGFYAYA